jgi:hypothetical protein
VPTQPPLDPQSDDRALPGESHHIAASAGSAGRARLSQITEGVDLVVPVRVTDRSGVEVVHAEITTWVTPAG